MMATMRLARGRLRVVLVAVVTGALASTAAAAARGADDEILGLLGRSDWDALRARGREQVEPALLRRYRTGDETQRAQVAGAFYKLGWTSTAAKELLLDDVRTPDANLRLNVQYALGRVSGDPDVVDALLANMRTDPNPLFRDKAACALAYDQIHLSEPQKVRLFAGLIAALEDPQPQVRAIAIKALQIHTGQTKGFKPHAAPEKRAVAVAAWQAWLAEYQAQF
jgi:hypothetical protein